MENKKLIIGFGNLVNLKQVFHLNEKELILNEKASDS